MPSVAVAEAEASAERYRDPMGRRLRADAPIIAAGVISMPADRLADWPKYRDQVLEALREEYGDRLRSVIEHKDEPHPHLHFCAVPKPGEGVEAVHPGYRAQQAARRAKAPPRDVKAAYCAAMRDWQDRLYAKVSAQWGLARLGPRRQRLDRGEWHAQKAALDAVAEARRAVDRVRQQAIKQGHAEGVAKGRTVGLVGAQRLGTRIGAVLDLATKPITALLDLALRPDVAEARASAAEAKAAKAAKRAEIEAKARTEAEARAERAERSRDAVEPRERAVAARERELDQRERALAPAETMLKQAKEAQEAAARLHNEIEEMRREQRLDGG